MWWRPEGLDTGGSFAAAVRDAYAQPGARKFGIATLVLKVMKEVHAELTTDECLE